MGKGRIVALDAALFLSNYELYLYVTNEDMALFWQVTLIPNAGMERLPNSAVAEQLFAYMANIAKKKRTAKVVSNLVK